MEINKEAYQKLIDGNIEVIKKYIPEDSLERKHIIEVLNWSVDKIYITPVKTHYCTYRFWCTDKSIHDGLAKCLANHKCPHKIDNKDYDTHLELKPL